MISHILLNYAPHHEDIWENESTAPYILNLSSRSWVVSFLPWPLYLQGKSPWYLLDRRLGEHQSQSGHGGKEKKSLQLVGIKPHLCSPQLSHYADWGIPAPMLLMISQIKNLVGEGRLNVYKDIFL